MYDVSDAPAWDRVDVGDGLYALWPVFPVLPVILLFQHTKQCISCTKHGVLTNEPHRKLCNENSTDQQRTKHIQQDYQTRFLFSYKRWYLRANIGCSLWNWGSPGSTLTSMIQLTYNTLQTTPSLTAALQDTRVSEAATAVTQTKIIMLPSFQSTRSVAFSSRRLCSMHRKQILTQRTCTTNMYNEPAWAVSWPLFVCQGLVTETETAIMDLMKSC